MITENTTNIRAANSIEEMQQIARNQITFKIWKLEERITHLEDLKANIADIVDFESYKHIAADCIDYGDTADLTAVLTLAEYYETMKAGNYF